VSAGTLKWIDLVWNLRTIVATEPLESDDDHLKRKGLTLHAGLTRQLVGRYEVTWDAD